jgi:uncharacterized protein YjeT (DUF2065 family)
MSTERALKNSYTYVGILLIFEGLIFLIFPKLAIKLLFLNPLQTTQAEQYVRSTGLGIGVIGYYYYIAGKYTLIEFFRYEQHMSSFSLSLIRLFRASVVGRLFVLPFLFIMIYIW